MHLFFFSYFDDFFSLTVQVKRYYTSYLHLRLFVWESLISFHFLNFVFISHAIRHQYNSSVSFSMNEIDFTILRKKKIWRSWYLICWSDAYVIEWNRKIFYLSIFLISSTIVVIWTQMIHLWLVWKKSEKGMLRSDICKKEEVKTTTNFLKHFINSNIYQCFFF